MDRCFGQVMDVFREAAAAAGDEERLMAMGHAYEDRLLPDRHALLFQMQAYAASEPEIRAYVREGYRQLVRTSPSSRVSTRTTTWDFFAHGMLLNVLAMLEIDWMPER